MEGNNSVVKYPAGSGDIIAPVINKRGRKPNLRKQVYQCDECLYESDRNFNVDRHRIRIHCKKINKQCCGKKFRTKADWYYHVEDCHPSLREKSFVSKQKYQILGSQSSCKRSERLRHEKYSCRFYASKTRTRVQKIYSSSSTSNKRSSLRIKKKLESKCLLMLRQFNATGSPGYDLDELPLYYRLKYPELRGDSSYQSPEDYQLAPAESRQIELNTPVKIDFSSDFTDDFHFSDAASLRFTNYADIINNINDDNKLVDYSDDSGFTESLTIPEVDHEEIIEQVVEEEAQQIIREDEIENNYFSEFKIQSVKQKAESNIIESDGANLDFLPPKKRILRQWQTNVISSCVRQRKPKIKSNKSIKRVIGVSNDNDENINPNVNKEKDKGFKIVVCHEKMSIWHQNQSDKDKEGQVVVMQKKSREIYWNAEERHRAFLNYFDFDRFKIL
ncbi:GSCOCG00007245001-RA-CDS [Cotesia congregata]|nr:GSCOCG00007245001-RA-CDS [Cotesia congregata]